MSSQATGTYEIQNWEEQTYQELGDGAKLSRARITNAYRGDVEGEGTLECLMFYPDAECASFVGHERVVGRLGDRAGSFVLQHTATYGAGMAQGTCIVVPGLCHRGPARSARRRRLGCPARRPRHHSHLVRPLGADAPTHVAPGARIRF